MLSSNEKFDASKLPLFVEVKVIKKSKGITFGEILFATGLPREETRFATIKYVDDRGRARKNSYRSLWLCPPDEQKIIDHILKNPQFNEKNERVNLILLWDCYIDEMAILTEDENFDMLDFYSSLVKNLENQLNKLPNAPTKDDWEYLDEWLMK